MSAAAVRTLSAPTIAFMRATSWRWSAEFAAACAAVGLAVRPFDGEGVRCTVAEPAANDRLLEVCTGFGAAFDPALGTAPDGTAGA